MKNSRGFTVIELISALVLIIALITLGFVAKSNYDATSRDTQRKTAVNAFYYGLKEAYFKNHQSYPININPKNLPYIDAALFKDPEGQAVGQPGSDYHYEARDCSDTSCKQFEISARLEKEARYTKSSRD